MQQFCFSNAGADGFDWQVLASSRLSCNHLWYQPRSPPTKLRSKVRPWRENGKYGSCRGSNRSYSHLNAVRIFFITLVTWLKTRRAEWDSQAKCKAHLPRNQFQNTNHMQDDSKYHKVTSMFTPLIPQISSLEMWIPSVTFHTGTLKKGWKDRNSVLIWTIINFLVFIILINHLIYLALKLFDFFFSLIQFSPTVEPLKFWNV